MEPRVCLFGQQPVGNSIRAAAGSGYVYKGGSLLAVQDNGVNWVHQDPVTKSKRVTNSSGSIISTVELDPWGASLKEMDNQEMTQILQSIARSCCEVSLVNSLPLAEQLENEQAQRVFCEAVGKELDVKLTVEEVKGSRSLADFCMLVESQLSTNESGQTLVDIYSQLERLAKEEFHPKINYHWGAKWDDFLRVGDWFTRPEGLDTVEIVIRMEEHFNIKITDKDAASLNTIGQTVQYVWGKMRRSDIRDVAVEKVER